MVKFTLFTMEGVTIVILTYAWVVVRSVTYVGAKFPQEGGFFGVWRGEVARVAYGIIPYSYALASST